MAKGDGSKVLDLFLKYDQKLEGKNNDNEAGRYYRLNNQPYCALHLSYLAEKVGNKFFQNIKDKTGKYYLTGCTSRYAAYCPSLYTYAKAKGILKTNPDKEVVNKGDIILFSFGKYKDGIFWSDHVGQIISYNPKNGYFQTMEANTSLNGKLTNDGGGYSKKYRHKSLVTGFFSID